MSKKGIDVSYHQGTIDWAKVKAAGTEFAILRSGYGKLASQKDKKFEEYYQNCIANGIPVGSYWYSYAVTEAEAEQEAKVCLSVLNGRELQLPVFFDQEYEKKILALTTPQRTAICKKFIQTIIKGGYRCGIYCSADFANNKLNITELKDYPIWIAQYASKTTYNKTAIAIWQYSSKGSVDGIKGNVDMDTLYDEGLIQNGKKTSTKTNTTTASTSNKTNTMAKSTTPTFKVGKNYILTTEVRVREKPSLSGRIKKYRELTNYAKSHDKDADGALDQGTVVTVLAGSNVVADGYVWIKVLSGYMAAYDINKKQYYMKQV